MVEERTNKKEGNPGGKREMEAVLQYVKLLQRSSCVNRAQ
jgi:hypothetical protein